MSGLSSGHGLQRGPVTAAYRAAAEARRLEHSWIGPEHVLLALFAEPSPAAEALEELGVTRERVEEHARSLGGADPPPPAFVPGQGLSPNPAWYRLTGCAEGLALAEGRQASEPEHFVLAMVYGAHTLAGLLARVGSSQEALLEGLRRRGVRVPAIDPPRRARVDAEEGVDLDAALATARDHTARDHGDS